MTVGDLFGIRGYVLKHIYIPIGIKMALGRFSVNCDQKVQIDRIFHGESITLNAGYEMCEVAERAGYMDLNGLGNGERAIEEQSLLCV